MLYAPDAEVRALCAAGPSDEPDVTFINFGAGEPDAVGARRSVPGSGEQAVRIALAQAMRALSAHSGGIGSLGDASGSGEIFKETGLSIGSPAVAADWGGARCAVLHRTAWSTNAWL